MNNTIIYEQPLNEITRVSLRLEQLFLQFDRQQSDISQLGTRNMITSIINMLQLLDRPDLKSKLAKELSHHASNISHYSDLPEVDAKKLKDLMSQLEQLSHH